jgi:hypothetical protein
VSDGRLSAGVEASAFLRRAEQQGGFGMVLHRGDADRGTLLILVAEKGEHRAVLERRLLGAAGYGWTRTGPNEQESAELPQYIARARRNDPDCWVLELDIPFSERFIAETIAEG